jgi:mannose-6-phosphate isomerase-like protein (cupin superfamily)
MTTFPKTPGRSEVTPGDLHQLGLPFVMNNQSLFNFWNIQSGNYFVEMEGEFYGWDNASLQVTEVGPGQGPPVHTHPVEEIFVLAAGETAFFVDGVIHDMKGPAVVRVPPNTPHCVTTLGAGRNQMITFFSSNRPGGEPVDMADPFELFKAQSSEERDTMILNFRQILADFDADGDGRLSREEAPTLLKAQFDRYDTDGDGFITLEDAEGWN